MEKLKWISPNVKVYGNVGEITRAGGGRRTDLPKGTTVSDTDNDNDIDIDDVTS
jgi:hypothetical protein